MFAKQSTAVTLIIGPILNADGVEFTTADIGDISASKNGGTLTALGAPATLTHIANGLYALALAAGNVDTLGVLQVLCTRATFQMPPVSRQVLPANVFDSLVSGSDLLDVNTQRWNELVTVALPLVPTTPGRTLDVSAGGEAGIDWANVGSPAATQAFSDTTFAYLSSGGIDRIWQALTGTMTTVGSIGKKLADVVFNWNTTTPPTVAAIRAEMDSNSTQLAKLGTPAATIAGDIAAVKADTATAAAEVVKIPRRASAVSGGAAVTKTNTSVTPNESLTEVIS